MIEINILRASISALADILFELEKRVIELEKKAKEAEDYELE
ncbi:hypothetical protein SAMN05444392_102323 [Seinonella peptonophila]|uniref:Uncharacterized protein n=1 Tax=Seinonella peptonophila TaxID=112248 RepID=A0A1M4VEG6_9BACL|nr:hypothetical protein [Seinonella peptonophila]SHE67376.1 hypothetical protein SAMN05444392_102323 [Seinonella peptonophila]